MLRYKDSFSQNITAEYVGFTEKNDFSTTFYSDLPLLVTLMDRIFSVLPDHNKLKLAQNETNKVKIQKEMWVKFTRVWLDNAVLYDVRTVLFDIVMMIYF